MLGHQQQQQQLKKILNQQQLFNDGFFGKGGMECVWRKEDE